MSHLPDKFKCLHFTVQPCSWAVCMCLVYKKWSTNLTVGIHWPRLNCQSARASTEALCFLWTVHLQRIKFVSCPARSLKPPAYSRTCPPLLVWLLCSLLSFNQCSLIKNYFLSLWNILSPFRSIPNISYFLRKTSVFSHNLLLLPLPHSTCYCLLVCLPLQ